MTRIEECFPASIVRAVYDRLQHDKEKSKDNQTVTNVISLSAYRQKIIKEGGVVS